MALDPRSVTYDSIKLMGYTYSSSLLSPDALVPSRPYFADAGILEFPVATCPDHPAFAFDTFHSFSSRWTSHKSTDGFVDAFRRLANMFATNRLYLNVYLDPSPALALDILPEMVETLNSHRFKIVTYGDAVALLKNRTAMPPGREFD